MSAQRVSFAYKGRIFSPFTGAPADTQDGPNEKDASLLFVYYGNAGYGYVSKRLKDAVTRPDPQATAGAGFRSSRFGRSC